MVLRFRFIYTCFLSLLILFMAGCATPPTPVSKNPIIDLYKHNNWQAKGKLALRIDDKSQSANFSWKQNKFDFVIHLYGPLGQGSAYITKQGQRYTLKSKDGTLEAESAEALMLKANGWSIPVSNLIFWLRGLPSVKSPIQATRFYPTGALQTLKQNDWDIQYTTYQEKSGYLLPKKMKALRDNIKLTLFIKSWAFDKSDSKSKQ